MLLIQRTLNVARGEDAIFNITSMVIMTSNHQDEGYDFKSGILTISGVQYSKTIYKYS